MKKFIAFTLAIIMVLTMGTGAFAKDVRDFTDVREGAWYYEYVKYATDLGIITGTTDTTFSPLLPVTRGQFATIVARHFAAGNTFEVAHSDKYIDVSDDKYYAGAIYWITENSLLHGTSENTFSPESPITRQDAVTLLYNYGVKYSEIITREIGGGVVAFKDDKQIAEYARKAVLVFRLMDVVRGTDTGFFNPNDPITRAEAMAIYVRYCYYVFGSTEIPNRNVTTGGFVVPSPTPVQTPSPDPVFTPPPMETSSPDTPFWATEEYNSRMRAAFQVLINEARAERGLNPVVYNSAYQDGCDIRVSEFAAKFEMYGTSINAEQAHSRMDGGWAATAFDLPLRNYLSGENLCTRGFYETTTPEEAAQICFTAWMNSTGHRNTMMNERDTGFALSIHANTTYKWAAFAYISTDR